jgi:hypothetical protein
LSEVTSNPLIFGFQKLSESLSARTSQNKVAAEPPDEQLMALAQRGDHGAFEQLFGPNLAAWVKTAPAFNLDKVTTPFWMEANNSTSLFFEWEWFTGLIRLGKPVQLLYMPEAAHVLVKPWERMNSQQGNVDWFCFWLKGEEDPDPAKAEQYVRWR